MPRQRPIEMGPTDLQLRLEIGQCKPRVLEIQHRLAERLACPRELHRHVEGPLRTRLRRNRDAEPFLRQFAHQIDEPFALFAQAIGDRHAHVFEEQLRRIRLILPDLVEVAPALEAVSIRLDQHDRYTLPLGLDLGVGLDADQDEVGVLAIGDIRLRTIDDVVVAILFRGGAHALQVGTRLRLGHRDRGDNLARNQLGKPVLLLLLRPVRHEVIDHDIRLQRKTRRRAAVIRAFLIDDRVIPEIEPQPAISFRHGRAQQTQCSCLGPDRLRHDLGIGPRIRVRRDLVFHKSSHRLAERLMIFVVCGASERIERHGLVPSRMRFWRWLRA